MDLQMRLAVDILKSCPGCFNVSFGQDKDRAPAIAKFALDLAGAMLDEGVERKLIEPLADTPDLPAPLARQAIRIGKFGAQQNLAAAKEQSAYAGNEIQTVRPGPRVVS